MRKYIGLAILTFFSLYLYINTLFNLWVTQKVFFAVFIIFGVGLYLRLAIVFKDTRAIKKQIPLKSRNLQGDFVMTFIGAMLTYGLSIELGLGAVLASGIIGVFAALFMPKYAVAIFCGSFVGMSSVELLTLLPFTFASLVSATIFVFAKEVFNGYGGKLGTIALSSALIVTIVFREEYLEGAIFDVAQALSIVAVSAVAAFITYVMSIRLLQGPVLSSAFIGVLAGGFFPIFFTELGPTLAVVAFGASFVGMSSKKIMPHEGVILIAGVLFGLIFVFSAPYFGGAGGKLGTIAFLSVLMVSGLYHFLKALEDRKKCENSA